MFDIGMTELLMIAVVTILVVGPKELPSLLRNVAKYTGKLREMANDFKNQLDDAVKDTGLDEIKSDISDIRNANPLNQIKDSLNPLADDLDRDYDAMSKDEDFDDPADEEEHDDAVQQALGDDEIKQDRGDDYWDLWDEKDDKIPEDVAKETGEQTAAVTQDEADKSETSASLESDTTPDKTASADSPPAAPSKTKIASGSKINGTSNGAHPPVLDSLNPGDTPDKASV